MKRVFLTLVLLATAVGANAQSGGGAEFGADIHLFDFSFNAKRFEAGLNLGQAGSFSDYARFGIGANVLVNGFYVDFIKADPQHKYDGSISNAQYNDNVAFSINAGYQIPVLSWLRIMPLVGYSQTNDGITDGSSLSMSAGDSGPSWYHRYTVTPGSRKHYFNYGGGISVQPCKWFSVNLVATRHALYAGVAINAMAFVTH